MSKPVPTFALYALDSDAVHTACMYEPPRLRLVSGATEYIAAERAHRRRVRAAIKRGDVPALLAIAEEYAEHDRGRVYRALHEIAEVLVEDAVTA